MLTEMVWSLRKNFTTSSPRRPIDLDIIILKIYHSQSIITDSISINHLTLGRLELTVLVHLEKEVLVKALPENIGCWILGGHFCSHSNSKGLDILFIHEFLVEELALPKCSQFLSFECKQSERNDHNRFTECIKRE